MRLYEGVESAVTKTFYFSQGSSINRKEATLQKHTFSDEICQTLFLNPSFINLLSFYSQFKSQMKQNQQLSNIVFSNTEVFIEDILQINSEKPIDSIQFTRCNTSPEVWASIITALSEIPFRALIFSNCNLNIKRKNLSSQTELPFSNLHQLSSLTLSSSKLSQAQFVAISHLTNLTELNIQNESMISCYENIQALGKLRKLSIKQWICCKANAVPGPCPLERALGSQEQLMELTIENHAFRNEEFKSIQKLQNLKKLKISGTFQEGQWFSCICSLKNLRQLIISCYYGAMTVPQTQIDEIGKLEHLTKLVLINKAGYYKNYLFDLESAHKMSTLPDITYLHICHNKIGDGGCQQISKMKSLQILKVQNHLNITKNGMAFLSSLLNLQQLSLANDECHLSHSVIDAAGAAHLCKLVNLKKLNLNNNKIRDQGVKHISKMNWLREIYLEGNGIVDYGVAALPQILNLEVLSLSYNKIGNKQILELRKLTKLKQLTIYQCKYTSVKKLSQIVSLRVLGFSFWKDRQSVWRQRVLYMERPQLNLKILK